MMKAIQKSSENTNTKTKTMTKTTTKTLCSIDILTLEIFDQYLILDHHNIKKYIT